MEVIREETGTGPTPSLSGTGTVIGLACFCVTVCVLAFYNSANQLLNIWSTDALKSIGLAVPFISFALILRAWHNVRWETRGTWWGYALLAASAVFILVRDRSAHVPAANRDWLWQFPPLPLVAVIYALSMVLLFGGTRLLKAAWFPVVFMWFVIPVPQAFTRDVDLPLQYAAGIGARAFAHLLGERLTPANLGLMFNPAFGIFIVPGCDGVRGAIALGMAAIVLSYLYRFHWQVFVLFVAGAILTGYLLDFLRLCLLVLYDKIALPFPWMQHHAKIADYFIGGCLFLSALLTFILVANRIRHGQMHRDTREEPLQVPYGTSPFPLVAKMTAVLALAALVGSASMHAHRVEARAKQQSPAALALPAHVGSYTLTRTWNDTLAGGTIAYLWGDYAPEPLGVSGTPAPHVVLGISPILPIHEANSCHLARGEDAAWRGHDQLASLSGNVDFSLAAYSNGDNQTLEAFTVCNMGACQQSSNSSEPHSPQIGQQEWTRPVPLALKVTVKDTATPTNIIVPGLEASLAKFLANANVTGLTAPYSREP